MKHSEQESEEFKKYREQMHGSDYDDRSSDSTRIMRIIFAIFMVIVYIGMGILLILPSDFFGFGEQYAWIRISVGVMLMVYGVWRAYRAYAGLDTRL